jgi:hypothetical protein
MKPLRAQMLHERHGQRLAPQTPKGLWDRCRRLSQVLCVLSRSLASGADSCLPAPSPRRAALGVAFL